MLYIFDTSTWIAWWREYYPIRIFPDILALIGQDIEKGHIESPMEVKRELEQKLDDPLTTWLKNQKELFIKDQIDMQDRIAEISNLYPKLIKSGKKFNADPIVIAMAESKNATVVTEENEKSTNKIPSCCRELGVSCISLAKYIENQFDHLTIIRKEMTWEVEEIHHD